MFTDPTGMSANPVYDPEGNHIGNTKEGFTGEVLIYSGNKDKSFFENLSADDFLYSTDDDVVGNIFKLDDVINDISDNALSNIFTSIARSFEGYDGFRMSTIGDKIEFKEGRFNFQALYERGKGEGNIYGNRNYVQAYEGTVENIGLTIVKHEWRGHIMNDYHDDDLNHHKAYSKVMSDERFNKTTKKFQNYNLRRHADYHLQEKAFGL